MRLPELLALIPDPDAKLSRRKSLELIMASFITAPAVIRCSANLMPVRNRRLYDEYGFRDYRAFPPTLDEVKDYRRVQEWMAKERVMVSLSGAGFNHAFAMIDAEKRFEAMGLL